MVPLIELFEKSVDPFIVSKTSISILATAGMRLLTYQQKTNIIEKLKNELPNRVKTKILEVKIISGKMEGLYQWVANNYLQGHLSGDVQSFATKGIVELGGASLQIVYEKQKNNVHNRIFKFYNHSLNKYIEYKLHSESLLGYGLQSIYQWFFSSNNNYLTNDQK